MAHAQGAALQIGTHQPGLFRRSNVRLLVVDTHQLDAKRSARVHELAHLGPDDPIRFRNETEDLLFALADQPQRDGLHAAGAQAPPDAAPQHGTHRVTDQPVENTTGLLRIDEVTVDLPRMLKSLPDRPCRNLIIPYTEELPFAAGRLENGLEMPCNGFPFAVGIGRQIDRLAGLGGLLQLIDDFLLAGSHHILGLKPVFHVDAQALQRKIPDVADRGLDDKIVPQNPADRSYLGRRFDHYQTFPHGFPSRRPAAVFI